LQTIWDSMVSRIIKIFAFKILPGTNEHPKMDGFDVKVELHLGLTLHIAEEAARVGGAVLGGGHLDEVSAKNYGNNNLVLNICK
jgi:hypothetical protein